MAWRHTNHPPPPQTEPPLPPPLPPPRYRLWEFSHPPASDGAYRNAARGAGTSHLLPGKWLRLRQPLPPRIKGNIHRNLAGVPRQPREKRCLSRQWTARRRRAAVQPASAPNTTYLFPHRDGWSRPHQRSPTRATQVKRPPPLPGEK